MAESARWDGSQTPVEVQQEGVVKKRISTETSGNGR
jgi:hypothetical protein